MNGINILACGHLHIGKAGEGGRVKMFAHRCVSCKAGTAMPEFFYTGSKQRLKWKRGEL